MTWLFKLYESTVGKKMVMALTGAIIFGFTIVHMSGNLIAFAGKDAFNAYAATLKGNLPLLWLVRMVLLAAIPLHIATAVQLVQRNNAARPVAYGKFGTQATSLGAKSMRIGGIVLALFIFFHIAHYTLHWVSPEFASFMADLKGEQVHDAHRMVVEGFKNPLIALAYVVAMGLMAFHLDHGAWSFMQSLGINHPKINGLRRNFARFFAVALFLGFSSLPIGVLAGLIK